MKSIFLIIIIVLSLLVVFNPKIMVYQIIKKHFSTLVNDRNNKKSVLDYITFVLLPLITSVFAVLFLKISILDVNVLLTVFSIFAALLFNFLMLIIQEKDNIEKELHKLQKLNKTTEIDKFKILTVCISQTYYNVSFSILLSIISILLLLVLDIFELSGVFASILNGLIVFTSISFFLCLFMILKRIFILFNKKH